MTENEIRNLVVKTAKKYLGCKEADGSHKKIIDAYNAHKPLARGYSVKYTDAWCATYVSAVGILCGLTDIIFKECGCGQMIQLYKNKGRWKEADDYVPKPADLVMYDWDDTGKGDCTGWPEHVGIVESISGNTMKIIEGNMSDSVGNRTLKVNGKYIRGYCLPDYASKATEAKQEGAEKPSTPVPDQTEPGAAVTSKKATEAARNFLKPLAGTYKVTASKLNVRNGAGITKKIMVAIPKGTAVKCYGYYTAVLGTKWLYVQFTYKGVKYTGFASSKYLKK